MTTRYGTGRGGVPESTTSYDSRSEEGRERDRSYSDIRDPVNTSKDFANYTQPRDVTLESARSVPSAQPMDENSADSARRGAYEFHYPAFEKTEWSCDEAGGWQKLSFMFLVLTFLGHSIAVCTPYWVVGYLGDQMSLYEGIWLSCYRQIELGQWKCSTYDTIRNLFEQPPWYEGSQICAVLSVILLIPCMVAASLYSYVVSLSGRSRASWLLILFLAATAICSFLSWVVFAAGYDLDQDFPPGGARFHASFGLQIVSFLFCCCSLGTHIKDAMGNPSVWDSNKLDTVSAPRSSTSARPARGPYVSSGGIEIVKTPAEATKKSAVPKLPSFSMPKFPSALSRFRPGSGKGGNPSSAPAPDRVDGREGRRVESNPSGGPSQRGEKSTYRSYAPSSGGGSVSGYDSQV